LECSLSPSQGIVSAARLADGGVGGGGNCSPWQNEASSTFGLSTTRYRAEVAVKPAEQPGGREGEGRSTCFLTFGLTTTRRAGSAYLSFTAMCRDALPAGVRLRCCRALSPGICWWRVRRSVECCGCSPTRRGGGSDARCTPCGLCQTR